MSEEESKTTILKWFAPLAALVIFLLPILNTTLQYELSAWEIPIHWLLFLSALIGGGLATMAEYLREVYKKNKALLEEKITALENGMKNLSLERDITERDIMINSLLLVRDWDSKNAEIKTLKDLQDALNPKEDTEIADTPVKLPEGVAVDPDTGKIYNIDGTNTNSDGTS